ncbi:uncharacterized protein LOC123865282 [Maniola jurtina]|uniref:uncharacterized protein LOC123865282 n=1 Tax=Maniola jurtina TaxID=191418 RepID=UPI001E68B383|nr:uncharacterized protein LOC123865282 [Maniola jurtina]
MLQKSFLDIIKPSYVLSVPFCMRKYKLKGGCISTLTKYDILFTVLGNLLMYILLYITLVSFMNSFEDFVFYIYVIIYVLYAANHTIHSILNITHSQVYVDTVLKLQRIDIILYNENDTKILKNIIAFFLVMIFSLYAVLLVMKLSIDRLWFWSRGIFIFLTVIFDLELFYIAFVIYFLARKIDNWSNKIKRKDRIISIKKMIRGNQDQDENDLYSVFENIIESLSTIEKTSQFTIISHWIMQFIQSIAYIQVWIQWSQNKMLDGIVLSSHSIGIVLWITKGTVIEIALCISCQILYRKLTRARTVVLLFLNDSYSFIDRRLAKTVLRIIDVRFRKLSGCGVFTVEAALPLYFTAQCTNYTLVLLQFAFL